MASLLYNYEILVPKKDPLALAELKEFLMTILVSSRHLALDSLHGLRTHANS